MTLPHIELGNSLSDISSGADTFIKGLLGQRERQAQLALQQALADAKMAEATKPEPGIHVTSQGPEGLVHGLMNRYTGQTSVATGPAAQAPESLIPIPTQTTSGNVPGVATIPRYRPGQPATAVQLPTGTVGRMEAPALTNIETPTGPQVATIARRTGAVNPLGVQPAADTNDERRARDAFEMIQSKAETDRALIADPKAHNEAAAFMAALDIAERVPLVGGALQQVIANAQGALSPAAAAYFNSFVNLAAARAFSRGGQTLTRAEIDAAIGALRPRLGESGDVTAMRDRLFNGVLYGSIAGNAAWQRYAPLAARFGFNFDDAPDAMIPPSATPKPNYNRFLTPKP